MKSPALRYDPRTERISQELSVFALVLVGLFALSNPGVLIGAAGTWLSLREARLNRIVTWFVAGALSVLAFFLRFLIVPLWPWRIWNHTAQSLAQLGTPPVHSVWPVLGSIVVETLAGPFALLITQTSLRFLRGGLAGQMHSERLHLIHREHAVRGNGHSPDRFVAYG